MTEFYIDDYNLTNLTITKKGRKYVSYSLKNNEYEPMKLKFKNVKLMFGVEQYNNKYILNIQLCGSNELNNYYSTIKNLDLFMKNLRNEEFQQDCKRISNDFKSCVKNRHYTSCLREYDGYKPLLRTHLKFKGSHLLTSITKDGVPFNVRELKGKLCNLELELVDIWSTQYKYGYTIYINSIEILDAFCK